MHILYVSPRQCWPAAGGAKLRDYHLAKALGARARLHYVYFSAPAGQPLGLAELPFCDAITAAPPIRSYTPGKIARGLLGRRPLSVLNYTSPEMAAILKKIAGAAAFDVLHLDCIHLSAYEPLLRSLLPKARVVYNWHNIESDILSQYAVGASPARKLYSTLTARKMAALEFQILQSAFGHVVCSGRERDKLAALAPGARIEAIENGVDTSRFPATPRAGAPRNRIVFVGLMNYHANVDGAIWFTREVWPEIHRRFPSWRLTLVGAEPVAAVRELASQPGVEVTGTVPDVAPFYEKALAAIVPLRSGGGTRLKILEAMAAGTPVVSTPIGAEGLEISPGENILLAPAEGPGYKDRWMAHLDSLA